MICTIRIVLLSLLLGVLNEINAETYIFGIPYNYKHKHTSSKVVITTASGQNISYSVSVNDILLGEGFVSYSQPAHVSIPEEYIVNNPAFTNRYKGIIVEALGNVSVIAINSYINTGASTGVFQVLPFRNFPFNEYTYIAINSKSKRSSLLLLVGGIDNTTIHIKPSVNVSIPNDPQSTSTANIDITKGNMHTITLHQAQTLLLEADGEDLSGTEIVSNKPLSVISGHECLNIPSAKGGCDQVLAQIPPTVTWGKDFLLVPFAGRKGQIYKIVSSAPNTVIEHNCENDIIKRVSLIQGQTIEVNNSKACHLKSNEPILVAQFALGQDVDGLGDPALMIVPPLEQYVDQVTFESLPIDFSFPKQYITIISPSNHFSPTLVQLDGNLIHCKCMWSLIYSANYSEITGYYCQLEMTSKPGTHLLNYRGSNGRFAVMMYGFNANRYKRQGYAYNGGQNMAPINAAFQINFAHTNYNVSENDGNVTIKIQRHIDISYTLNVLVTTHNLNALSGQDYKQLNETISFGVGVSQQEFDITIIDDVWAEQSEKLIIKLEILNHYSSPKIATITIKDDDSIKIGFLPPASSAPNNSLQITTFEGTLQPDDELHIKLWVALIDTDMQGNKNMTSFTQIIQLSHNKTAENLSLHFFSVGVKQLTIVGILSSTEDDNNYVITLDPSIVLIPITEQQTLISQSTHIITTVMPSSLQISANVRNGKWYLIALITALLSILTGVFVSILGCIGCIITYHFGKKHSKHCYSING